MSHEASKHVHIHVYNLLDTYKRQEAGKNVVSDSINDRFGLKALLTVAEVTTLSVSFFFKGRKIRVTEQLNSYIYVFKIGYALRNI